MRANETEINRLLRANGGIISRRAHPDLVDALAHLVQAGRLRRLLPGVYALPEIANDHRTRMRAVAEWNPDAVLTGAAAARLTFWPDIHVDALTVAVSGRRQAQPGFVMVKRKISAELTCTLHGLRCTVPALTALDLCPSHGGDGIDAALRSRSTTLAGLHEALRLTPQRRGNADRRRLLLDSRDEPWSAAERQTHRLLRDDGITGWVANYPLLLHGAAYYLDVAFPEARLALEIDGRAFHTSPDAFERDRFRQNDLVLAGWHVLRFTWTMVTQQPEIVLAVVQDALQKYDSRRHRAA